MINNTEEIYERLDRCCALLHLVYEEFLRKTGSVDDCNILAGVCDMFTDILIDFKADIEGAEVGEEQHG